MAHVNTIITSGWQWMRSSHPAWVTEGNRPPPRAPRYSTRVTCRWVRDQVPLLLVRSKIGLVNAASAVTGRSATPRTAWASSAQVPAGGLARGIKCGRRADWRELTLTLTPTRPRSVTRAVRVPSYDGQAADLGMRSPHWSRCVSRRVWVPRPDAGG